MHSYQIQYAKVYRNDIIHILDYISEHNATAAIKLSNKIELSIERLASFPFSGSIPYDSQLRLKGYRLLIIEFYAVFYIPSVNDETIKVHRILSLKQDYVNLILGN